MDGFDRHAQSVRFLRADGETHVDIPIPTIDTFNAESLSMCLNFGIQIGVCIAMLLVLPVMTPSSKFNRASTTLHIVALVVCIIRTGLLTAFYLSPFNEFYNYFAGDYSSVSAHHYHVSVVANVFNLLLVIVVEAALMNQAWAMVHLWPSISKYAVVSISLIVTLQTVGWRTAYVVFLNQFALAAVSPTSVIWVAEAGYITNAVSICWYCAVFNVKLVFHIATRRGVLPSLQTLTPMEVLVVTNGLLMVVPVTFTGLGWAQWANSFSPMSLTLTSVVFVLPLGTLAAQRLSQYYGSLNDTATNQSQTICPSTTNDSSQPLKVVSRYFAVGGHDGTTPQTSIPSRCEAGPTERWPDHTDIELAIVDSGGVSSSKVRVDHGIEQY